MSCGSLESCGNQPGEQQNPYKKTRYRIVILRGKPSKSKEPPAGKVHFWHFAKVIVHVFLLHCRMFKSENPTGPPKNGLFCIRNSSTKAGKVIAYIVTIL